MHSFNPYLCTRSSSFDPSTCTHPVDTNFHRRNTVKCSIKSTQPTAAKNYACKCKAPPQRRAQIPQPLHTSYPRHAGTSLSLNSLTFFTFRRYLTTFAYKASLHAIEVNMTDMFATDDTGNALQLVSKQVYRDTVKFFQSRKPSLRLFATWVTPSWRLSKTRQQLSTA
jgi:hypothetical protein